MVIVVGPAETAESVRELNFRHEFEIGEIHERSVSTIQHQLEQDAEHITHLVYDIRAIGNVDASLALLGRICTTIPGITGKTIVVTEGIAGSSSFMRDVCEMYPKEQIVQSHGAELKRVLNAMLCADGIIRTEPEPQKVTAADPVPDPQEPPPSPPIPVEVTPPSQVGREAAQAQLVLPKPKIERSATCIAVAGAGHRIGTTTQAMQICLYVKALGYKAAIIEMAASALTGYTQISDDAVLFDEHHFRVEGTDVYNDRTCILDAKSQYDYLILDYGCFAELTEPADYLRNDILVAVCGAKPSEVELAAYGGPQRRAASGTVAGNLWHYGKGQGSREKIPDRANAPRTDQRRVCSCSVRCADCNRRACHHRAGNADLSQHEGGGAGNMAGDRDTAC